MTATKKKAKYLENLELPLAVKQSGYKIQYLADQIGVSRVYLSNIIHGHEKGVEVVKKLKELLNK